MTPRDRWRAAFLASVLVQLVVLYAPRAPSTGGVPGVDKVIHATVFGAVAFTALRSGFAPRWVALVLVLHAGISETLQATVLPHRDGDWRDAAADCAGIALGCALAGLHRSREEVGAWHRP